ncbi:MAG: DUF5615 family PIN-like protein [Acidobacteria bacterium]|nr:DUF5615 family PIN-like protein [Acidobacteriota bacterium]
MLKLVIDQDFDHDILRGVLRRLPELDFVTALEAGLSETEDQQLLLWASANKRILLTHDRKTVPKHFAALLDKGSDLTGVFIVPRRLPIGQAIDGLEMMIVCSEIEEWRNIVKILPL